MQPLSEIAQAYAAFVPTSVRSEEDRDLLERSTKKTKTLSAYPEGFVGAERMEGIEGRGGDNLNEAQNRHGSSPTGERMKAYTKSYKESLARVKISTSKDNEVVSDDEVVDVENDLECPEIKIREDPSAEAVAMLLDNQGSRQKSWIYLLE